LFLPHRTRLVFVRNVCIGVESWHVNGLSATFAGEGAAYDFDPTTFSKISGKTPSQPQDSHGICRLA
jgi:hypothetical protein